MFRLTAEQDDGGIHIDENRQTQDVGNSFNWNGKYVLSHPVFKTLKVQSELVGTIVAARKYSQVDLM